MQLSPRYINYYAQYILGDNGDDGATGLSGARAVKGKGACREGLWPQCLETLSVSSLKLADRDAITRRDAFYQRCYNINDIKNAISNYLLPVNICFKVFDSIDKAEKYGVVPLPDVGENQINLHSVCLLEYNDNLVLTDENGNTNKGFFRFLNSWGKEWGDNGYGYLPYSYLNNITEIMIIIPYNDKIDYKKFEIKHKNEKLFLARGISTGYTLTHNNIIFTDLYTQNHELLGWIITSRIDEDTIEMIDFFIWPDYCRNGYGQALLYHSIEYWKRHNYKYIYGWFSNDDNLKDGWMIVTKFFRINGFECTQNKTVYPWATGRIDLDLY